MDGFLDIGVWELLLIFAIILVLLGPRRLPEIAARLGAFYRRLKRASYDFTSQLSREVDDTPGQDSGGSFDALKKAASDLKESLSAAASESRPDNAEHKHGDGELKAQD